MSATDFYTVLDTSDVPAGVVNIVTGEANALATTLAEHDGVDALWYVGDPRARRRSRPFRPAISRRPGSPRPPSTGPAPKGREFLRRATQVKNIWTPYGE